MKLIHRYQTKTIHTMKPSRPGFTHCLPVVLLLWSTCLLLTGCGKRSYQQFMLGQDPAIPSHSAIQAPMVNPYDLSEQSSEETFQQFFVERGAEVIWTKLYFYFGSPFQPQDVNMVIDDVIYNDGEVKEALSKQNQLDQANMHNAIVLYIAIKKQEAACKKLLESNGLPKEWEMLQYTRFQENLDLRRMLQACDPVLKSHILEQVLEFIGNYCPHVVSLNLSDNGLTQLPAILGKLTNLKRLFLKDNQLAALPDNLGDLKNLEILDLSFNKFAHLPATLGKLTNLRELCLIGNQLIVLPDSFGDLTQLRRIELSDNQLTDLPESFQKLTKLEYSQGQCFTAGTAFKELKALVFLNFLSTNGLINMSCTLREAKDNKQRMLDFKGMLRQYTPLLKIQVLQGLFHFIQDHLPGLIQLKLSHNRLTQLPDSFETLAHLQMIDLSANQLMALPDSFGSLTQLRILNLESNDLQALPDTFVKLTQLQELNLNNNQLGQFPACLQNLTQLRGLDLSSNQVQALPAWLANLNQLQILDLERNQLIQLPDSIGKLTQLQKLNLSNNQLSELPACLGNFTQLQRLYLRENQLTVLPGCLQKLTNLRELTVYNNPLLQLSANIGPIQSQLTASNVHTFCFPSLTELAARRIFQEKPPYNTTGHPTLPADCVSCIQNPKTYPVMLFTKHPANITPDQVVPIVTNLSYHEILDQLSTGSKVILMNQ